jgi:putative transposase
MNSKSHSTGLATVNMPSNVAAALLQNWDLETYLTYHPVSKEARAYIEASLVAPSRNPTGRISNTTRHVSTKTLETRTTESDLVELPVAIMCDRSDDVLFYVAQPAKLQTLYPVGQESRNHPITPDFLIFWRHGIEIIEAKSNKEAASIAIKRPHYFQQKDDGSFRCPPAEAGAQALGLPYRIVTETDFCSTLLKNFQLLSPHYSSSIEPAVNQAEWTAIRDILSENPGTLLTELPIEPMSRRSDVVYHLIANRSLFAHMETVDLRDQAAVRLFLTPLQETAFSIFANRSKPKVISSLPVGYMFPVGSDFKIRRDTFTVIRHLGSSVEVLNARTRVKQRIPYLTLLQAAPSLPAVKDDMLPTFELIGALDEGRMTGFLRNYRIIAPYLPGGKLSGASPDHRNTRRLLDAYRAEENKTGRGERALIPSLRPDRTPKFSDRSMRIADTYLQKHFLSEKAASAMHVYRLYADQCRKESLPLHDIMSGRAFQRRVAKITHFQKALKRYGRRAALRFSPPRAFATLLGDPNGYGPWALGHIDHTLLDLMVKNPITGEYERPWISAMVDGYDGRILAFIVWFGSPNTEIVFDLIEDCAARHGTLPMRIICDWGTEFRSTAVQTALARSGISLRYRPKGMPRGGAPVETSFNSFNKKVVHNAVGNTKAMKNPRSVSRSHNPEANAVWTLEALKPKLNEYVDLHNALPRVHEESPNDVCSAFLEQFGYHYARWISPDILQRLRQNPVKGNTRIVSDKATIRLNTVDYGSEELKALVGREVKVFTQKDPRVIYVDDPVRKLQIICHAYTADIKHATSPEEAAAVVAQRMTGSYDRRKKADEMLGSFVSSFDAMEEQLAKEKAKAACPPKTAEIKEPKIDNGFIDLASIASIPAAGNE